MEQREIKFRGISLDTGKWIYGYLIFDSLKENAAIVNKQGNNEMQHSEINPKTAGQFTGQKDRYGEEIYEGDILEENNNGKILIYEVKWDKINAGFIAESKELIFGIGVIDHQINSVIGNVFEHPHLLQ